MPAGYISCGSGANTRCAPACASAAQSRASGGLLELAFPGGSKIVVNTQPPLHEVWLAARAGGFHYRHVNGRWLDTRDGSEFFDVLSKHASEQGGLELRFMPN